MAGSKKGASLPHAILLAAAMSVENPFLHSAGHDGGTAAAASAQSAAGSRNKDAGGVFTRVGTCSLLQALACHACICP